jgi:hypothetical protein
VEGGHAPLSSRARPPAYKEQARKRSFVLPDICTRVPVRGILWRDPNEPEDEGRTQQMAQIGLHRSILYTLV